MSKAAICVVVPVYKAMATLDRCVESVLAQQVEGGLTCILVDDGSPDESGALCDVWAAKDDRVTVIHQDDLGVSGARNSGLAAADSEFIVFLDSDDALRPGALQAALTAQRAAPQDFVVWHYTTDEKDPAAVTADAEPRPQAGLARLWLDCLLAMPWNKLYRAELFKETGIRYPEGRIHEDEATTYRLFHEAKKLAFLDRALYGYYTENGGSITSVFSAKRLQWLTAHEERIAFFKKNGYEKLLPAAYRKLCDACITFYFRCTEQVKDAEELKKELRKRLETYRANGAAWIAALPLKTRMGYELFSMSPGLYAKMLQKMQETS